VLAELWPEANVRAVPGANDRRGPTRSIASVSAGVHRSGADEYGTADERLLEGRETDPHAFAP
jgi:hypothetical protein